MLSNLSYGQNCKNDLDAATHCYRRNGSILTGDIRNQIDRIWDAFWSGGISNPLEVMEQITYLLFLRRLDDLQTLEENKSARLGRPIERRVFPEGSDPRGKPYAQLRWSRFKHAEAREMFTVVGEHVFPFLRTLGGDDSTYAHHMKDARFTIPTPALLAKVVDLLEHVPMEDRDTKGDLYEYMLGKIASAGQNGQFRTPRHIIRLMVEMTAPQPPTSSATRPAAPGLPGGRGRIPARAHPEIFRDAKLREHFHHGMFHGFDFDNTMLRIGSMNMLLHGVENPDIVYRDSLAQDHAGEEEKYTLVLANPPFAGSLDYENCAKDLLQIVKTKKTELLFLALFLRLLKPGGRAAVIVPDGVLFGSSTAHKDAAQTARRGAEARRRHLAAWRCVQALRRRLHRDPALHQDQLRRHRPRLVLRRRGRRLEPRRQTHAAPARGQARPRASTAAQRRGTRQEQPARRAGALAAAGRGRARAPAHRAELLRAEGGHRGPWLRPQPQPLQGSRLRGGRAPPAEADPRRTGRAGAGD